MKGAVAAVSKGTAALFFEGRKPVRLSLEYSLADAIFRKASRI